MNAVEVTLGYHVALADSGDEGVVAADVNDHRVLFGVKKRGKREAIFEKQSGAIRIFEQVFDESPLVKLGHRGFYHQNGFVSGIKREVAKCCLQKGFGEGLVGWLGDRSWTGRRCGWYSQ